MPSVLHPPILLVLRPTRWSRQIRGTQGRRYGIVQPYTGRARCATWQGQIVGAASGGQRSSLEAAGMAVVVSPSRSPIFASKLETRIGGSMAASEGLDFDECTCRSDFHMFLENRVSHRNTIDLIPIIFAYCPIIEVPSSIPSSAPSTSNTGIRVVPGWPKRY